MEMGIDVFQEGFLAFRAHDEYVVFVNLAVQVFLAVGGDIPNESSNSSSSFALGFRNYSIEQRSNPYRYLVLERSFGSRFRIYGNESRS